MRVKRGKQTTRKPLRFPMPGEVCDFALFFRLKSNGELRSSWVGSSLTESGGRVDG
jgi:hypothetical protein